MLCREGFFRMVYVDNFVGCLHSFRQSQKLFDLLIALFDALGLALYPKKCTQPTVRLTWLHFIICMEEMIVRIPEGELQDVINHCDSIQLASCVTPKRLQALHGYHLSSSIPPRRKFMGRLFAALRGVGPRSSAHLNEGALRDINWFRKYASSSNGTSILPPPHRPTV